MRGIIIISFLCPFFAAAQQTKPNALQDKAMVLKRFMEQHHYKPLHWNDSASILLYDRWLNELDEDKMIFTQKDMAVLQSYRTALNEEMNGKGRGFYTTSFGIYRARLHFADSVVQAFLAKPPDLSKPDSITRPYKDYAANETELAKRYRAYLKWQILDNIYDRLSEEKDSVPAVLPADFGKQETESRARLLKRHLANMQAIQSPQKFDEEMQDQYLEAITWCYDPHSNYMNLKARDAFEAEVSAMEYSAGFSFDENNQGEKVISYLQPGGSAWRSGQLHKGDIIIKIKNNSTEKAAADLSKQELARFLNTEGTGEITVTVRSSAGETRSVKLGTEKVADDEEIVKSFLLKGAKNIGYINLPGFYSHEEEGEKEANFNGCANDVSKELIKLKKDNISGLILDLRDNGGGSMWEAMQLAGIFIDAGPVASIREKDGKISFLKDPNRGTLYDGPMIILVNGQSASASEFFSATMQDYNRALIVGGTTYGKGTAQSVEPLDTNKADPYKKYEEFVKVTGQKFYRVNGSTVQWTGVVPDIMLPDLFSDVSFKEKAQASALQPDMSKPGYFQPLAALPLAVLKAKSESRIKNDPYFNIITRFTDKMKTLKNGITIPLQWPAFVRYNNAETAEMVSVKEEKKIKAALIPADNNSFDEERMHIADANTKEINTAYLKNISGDKEIAEACKILEDWIQIK